MLIRDYLYQNIIVLFMPYINLSAQTNKFTYYSPLKGHRHIHLANVCCRNISQINKFTFCLQVIILMNSSSDNTGIFRACAFSSLAGPALSPARR